MKKFHRTNALSTLFLLIVLFINYTLGQQLWNLDQIFPFAIMPPGITFAIAWSTIYLWLILAIWSWWSKRVNWNKQRAEVSHLFWISCIFNIWRIVITSFQEYGLSVAILWGLCYILFILLRNIKEEQKSLHAPRTTTLPLSLYLGRISTAFSIIGISQLVHLWFGPEVSLSLSWTLSALAVWVIFISTIIAKTYTTVAILPIFALIMVARKNFQHWNMIIWYASVVGIIIILWVVLSTRKTWQLV